MRKKRFSFLRKAFPKKTLPIDQTVFTPDQISAYLDNAKDTSNLVYAIIDHSVEAAYLGCLNRNFRGFQDKEDFKYDFESKCWMWILEELQKGIKGEKKSYNYKTSLDVFLRLVLETKLLKEQRKYGRKDVSQETNRKKRDLAEAKELDVESDSLAMEDQGYQVETAKALRNVENLRQFFCKKYEIQHNRILTEEELVKEFRKANVIAKKRKRTDDKERDLKEICDTFGDTGTGNLTLDPDVFDYDTFESDKFSEWYFDNRYAFETLCNSTLKFDGPCCVYYWDFPPESRLIDDNYPGGWGIDSQTIYM